MKLFGELKGMAQKYCVQIIAFIVLLLLVLSGLAIWKVVTSLSLSPASHHSFYSSTTKRPITSSTHFSSSTTKKPPIIHYNRKITLNWFNQAVDHFNLNDNRTFEQRFWLNDKYYNGNGIQFLYIGGQQEESASRIDREYVPIVSWAKRLEARIWNLEHRFFGESHPTEDMSVENLKYLSSRQALEDLAGFIRAKNDEFQTENLRWVVFGGSYTGRLALWFRDKYSNLTVGAIASSAPLKLVIDYPDYNRIVEKVYKDFDSQCYNDIRDALRRINILLKTRVGRWELNKLLWVYPYLSDDYKLSEKEVARFFNGLSHSLSTQRTTLSQLKRICDAMKKNKDNDLVTRLINAIKINNPDYRSSFNYAGGIEWLRDTSFYSSSSKSRGSLWIICAERGFFTTLNRCSFFGQNVSVNYFYDRCMDVFGKEINTTFVQNGIKKAIEYYGPAEKYNATNVVLTNGNLDPWYPLGIHESKNPSMITIMIDGISHCKDIYRLADGTDPIGLKNAQNVIFENLQKWTNVPVN